MLGSPILDVAIGLVLVYLLLAIVASAIREWLESILKSRGAQLERGIRELLGDGPGIALARALYEHPLISSLYRGTYSPADISARRTLARGLTLPSYIPKESFALALIDIVVRGSKASSPTEASAGSPRIELGTVRAQIASIQNPPVQRALLVSLDTAGGDLDHFRRNVEAWFDSSMDRVSGWYKRETQQILLVIGIVLAIAGNVDTIGIAHFLYANKPARDAVVAEASAVAHDSTQLTANIARVNDQLKQMDLPIGWVGVSSISEQVWHGGAGWIITGFAVSFGAPFWFDLLNKLIVVRSTVKPKEKSGDEGSKDKKAGTKAAEPPPPSPAPNREAMSANGAALSTPHKWAAGDPNVGVL